MYDTCGLNQHRHLLSEPRQESHSEVRFTSSAFVVAVSVRVNDTRNHPICDGARTGHCGLGAFLSRHIKFSGSRQVHMCRVNAALGFSVCFAEDRHLKPNQGWYMMFWNSMLLVLTFFMQVLAPNLPSVSLLNRRLEG
jgi:hypothetical protein